MLMTGSVYRDAVSLESRLWTTSCFERLHVCQSESGWQNNYYVDLQTSEQVVTGGVYRHASEHCANRAR
ncbi:hypothetical protein TYRP_001222 [Tyrophagus putrescentiae]|nr:hypothetical protein TYRP_001222 [Tyrophagus putrescentiae]